MKLFKRFTDLVFKIIGYAIIIFVPICVVLGGLMRLGQWLEGPSTFMEETSDLEPFDDDYYGNAR